LSWVLLTRPLGRVSSFKPHNELFDGLSGAP
jgi:hypothetical protein